MTALANKIITLARSQLLTKENPPGSNNVKYNTAYYGRAVNGADYPWCCVFIWWLFQQVDAAKLFFNGSHTASCGALANYAKVQKLWIDKDFEPGDLAFMRFTHNYIEHIGLVIGVRADGSLLTIEGNTGKGNDANGGQVQQRVRKLTCVVGGYRPRYSDMEEDNMAQIIEQIAKNVGISNDEAVKRLTVLIQNQDTKLDDYQVKGVQWLKDNGLIWVARSGLAQVNWGDFGVILQRLHDKLKTSK